MILLSQAMFVAQLLTRAFKSHYRGTTIVRTSSLFQQLSVWDIWGTQVNAYLRTFKSLTEFKIFRILWFQNHKNLNMIEG